MEERLNDVPEKKEGQKIDASFLEPANIQKMPWDSQRAILVRVLNYNLQNASSRKYEEGPRALDLRSSNIGDTTTPPIQLLSDLLGSVLKARPGTNFFDCSYTGEYLFALRTLRSDVADIGKPGYHVGFVKALDPSDSKSIGEASAHDALKPLRDKELIDFIMEIKREMATAPVYKQGVEKRKGLGK